MVGRAWRDAIGRAASDRDKFPRKRRRGGESGQRTPRENRAIEFSNLLFFTMPLACSRRLVLKIDSPASAATFQ